jgi:hypothetical protein
MDTYRVRGSVKEEEEDFGGEGGGGEIQLTAVVHTVKKFPALSNPKVESTPHNAVKLLLSW